MADVCCAANQQQQLHYMALCNDLAGHLSTILNMPMHPHTCFEDFRKANNKPTYLLTRKFVEKIKILQQQSLLMESIRKIFEQKRFAPIAAHIERKQEAEQITSILLPYILRW